MLLNVGDRIDRYVVLGILGSGGMGEVYAARDTVLDRKVALKLLRRRDDSLASAEDERAKLVREARAAARLDHPNVVVVHDVGVVNEPEALRGTPFIAMELVDGTPLRAHIGKVDVPLAHRIAWLAQVAGALAAAHESRLVHRDVKPENVMVRPDGSIKVLDFGIAQRTAGSEAEPPSSKDAGGSSAGGLQGTPYYMSPEQLRREPLDARSDQFSWGVLAYELLAGSLPWSRSGDAATLVAEVLTRSPEPLRARCPEVPPGVADAVTRALAKDPGDRFPSMQALLEALGPRVDLLADTIDSPQGLDVPERAPAAPRRARAWAVSFALVAAVVALAAGAAWRARVVPAAPLVEARPGCRSNAECVRANAGKPFRCEKTRGACLALDSEDCHASAGTAELERDDTLWVGTMFPLTGPVAAEFGVSNAQAVELARRDFSETMGAFHGGGKEASWRPFGVVSCNDAVDATRAARHLVDDVGARAIIGFRSSAELVELAGKVFIPNGVLTLAALNTSALVTTLPQPRGDPRLVWRTTYNMTDTAEPLSLLVSEVLERKLRAPPAPPTRRVRVALARVNTAGSRALFERLLKSLSFNGKSAVDNGGDFRDFLVEEDDAKSAPEPVVDTLLEFAPDVVLYVGGASLMRRVIEPLEARWPKGRARPRYATMNVFAPETVRFVGEDLERRARFFGLTTVSQTPVNAQFVTHYNQTFADQVTRASAPNSSYDAFYLVAYAAYALGAEPVDGRALSRAMGRLLPPGTPIEVGPSSIFSAVSALRAGENVDVTGATGRLDFNPATGEAPLDFAFLCVGLDEQRRATDGVEAGLVYDAKTLRLAGALRCP